jgi:hypothetical protein
VDADAKKAGLWGGVTIDNSMLDIAGNRYLGSATATLLTSKYYDRTQSGLQDQDSTPATLANIGIDPNWYKGVSLQTISNLTASYNGSLIGVSGVYGTGSEHGYIDLTVTGTTTTGITANIISSDGTCSASGANLAFGSSYAFVSGSCSGSSITIKPVRSDYKNGDKFRIASWVVEPTTADDRGSKREFPERSVIIGSKDASYIYVTIVDVDTQRVWMKFIGNGAAYANGNMLVNNTAFTINSIDILNGQLYVVANSTASAAGYMNIDFVSDSSTSTHTTGTWKFGGSIGGRNIASAYTKINSTITLVSDEVNDVSAAVIPNQPTQEMTVSGWGYISGGTGWVAGANFNEIVNLPYKFDQIPQIVTSFRGYYTGIPSNVGQCYGGSDQFVTDANQSSTSAFNMHLAAITAGGTGNVICYTWTATGTVSPKQFVAVATGDTGVDGATTIINKTDNTKADVLVGSQYANILWSSKATLAENSLYISMSNDTTNANSLNTYYGVHGLQSDTTWGQFRGGYYAVGFAAGWGTNGPTILGSATGATQIKSLYATLGTSTVDDSSNTIYVGTASGVSVLQEKQGHANYGDSAVEFGGSVKYYTKDYISEQMVGDIRGMWPLNYDNTSADNEDISVKANSLTANNIDSNDAVSGVRGKAVDFNGTDEYLYRAYDTDFNVTTSGAIGAWVKTSSTATQSIISQPGCDAGVCNYTPYVLYMNNGNAIATWYNAAGTGATVTSSNTINDNAWHYVATSYNGSAVTLYVDGQVVSTQALTGSIIAIDNDRFFIGANYYYSNGVYQFFTGSIDEPMVTATALTNDQIKKIYEDGLRALKGSHTSADTYNQLSGTSNDIRDILVTPDSKYMYVGTEGGGISKIDLTSSTRLNAYTTATDPSTSTNNIETLSGRYYPVFAGDIGSSGALIGIDSNGNNSTGTYYSKVTTFAESTNRAFLWMTASIDATDTSSSITVSASNDNGANYVVGTLIQTNTSGSLPEYEYSFVFPTSDKNYKVKFEIARGSSNKASAYITKWGLSQMKMDTATVNGLFTNSNDVIANGSYLEVVHGQNTYDLVANGWVFDETLNKWIEISNTDNGITQNLSNQWNDANASGIIRSIVKLTDIELAPGLNIGTGADGAVTASSNTNINTASLVTGRSCANGGDAVNYSVISFNAAGTEATLSSSPSTGCLNVNDEILIINLQGTSSAYGNVGNYETLRIANVSGSTVTFTTAKSKYYGTNTTDDTNIGTGVSNQRVMLQRVPNYTNVTVNAGVSLSPSAWDGVKGGVLFFRANGTVSISGSLAASGIGYRGGSGGPSGREPGGYLGESFNGYNLTSGGGNSTAAINAGGRNGTQATSSPNNGIVTGGGGGGGSSTYSSPDEAGAGGGGGAYGGGGGGGGGSGGSTYALNGGAGGNGGNTDVAGGGGGAAIAGANGGAGGNAGNAGASATGVGGQAGSGSTSGSGGGGAATADAGGGGGGGGGLYGDAGLSRLYLGSGGGGGGGTSCAMGACSGPWAGEAGGAGGGIIFVSATTFNNGGTIVSNGNNGNASTYGGNGGSGSGGSVLLRASSAVLGTATITASGGAANGSAGGAGGGGGGGGVGRIAIYSSSSVTGTTSPTYIGASIGYYSYGIYNSGVISTTNAQSYDNLKWDAALNTYGKISVQTRSGATNNPADGTWEAWKPSVSGTNITTLQNADTHTDWTGTNATVAEGDITRPSIYGFEDEIEPLGTNITKVTSSTNGGYMESTINPTNLTNYDYVTLWVRASQAGNTLRIGIGESAGTEQYEDITIDTANVWQKVYWDISDISVANKDAITKLRLTNFSTSSNVVYLDSVKAEKLLSTNTGSPVASTPNAYMQYRVIFTTTNLSYQPQLENITFTYSSGFKIEIVDENRVRLYNNSGKDQKLKLDIILGSAAIDLRSSEYSVNIAPNNAQIDGGNDTNSIWINKMGTGGNLLKLQTNNVDMMVVSSDGNMTLAGDVAISGGSISLGTDGAGVRFNTTDGVVEFSNDGIAWMPLGESTRKYVLSAEYAGAVLSGDGTDNVGSMTSDNTGSSSNSMNYYEWNSSALSLNDYDVRVRFTLPSDFVAWGNGGIAVNFATESTDYLNNSLDIYVYLEGSSTVDASATLNSSAPAGQWTAMNIDGAVNLDECNAAGETCVIILRMSSLGDNYVRVGDIDITYNRSL